MHDALRPLRPIPTRTPTAAVQHCVGTQGQSLDYVCATTNSGVHQDVHLMPHRISDGTESIECRNRPVNLTPTMVAHDNAVGAGRDASRASSGWTIPFTAIGSVVHWRSFAISAIRTA